MLSSSVSVTNTKFNSMWTKLTSQPKPAECTWGKKITVMELNFSAALQVEQKTPVCSDWGKGTVMVPVILQSKQKHWGRRESQENEENNIQSFYHMIEVKSYQKFILVCWMWLFSRQAMFTFNKKEYLNKIRIASATCIYFSISNYRHCLEDLLWFKALNESENVI